MASPDPLRVLDMFRGIADALAQKAMAAYEGSGTDDYSSFYLHLQARLILVSGQFARVKPEALAAGTLPVTLLDRLESVISGDILSNITSPPSTRCYARTNALLAQWYESRQPKLETCNLYVYFGDLRRRHDLLSFLKNFENEVAERFPERHIPDPLEDYHPPKSKRKEPSDVIRAAAQALFDAITASKCSGHPDHEFRARLCLGTYRGTQPDEFSAFDMFLALEQFWQEVHVKAMAQSETTAPSQEPTVRFALDSAVAGTPPDKTKTAQRARVKQLCKAMAAARSKPTYRLQLVVEDGKLWKTISEKSKLSIDKSKPPVSLQHFLAERPHSLREKTKRILAVFLAYTVFHLQGTPWLESSWGSGSIIFFETAAGIPLKPYIQLPLKPCRDGSTHPQALDDYGNANADEDEEEEDDDFDPDNFLSHPFPNLVTLAVMLIELCLARPLHLLAEDYGLEDFLRDDLDHSIFILTLEIFDKCKLEISEQTRGAIDRCLDRNIGQDDNGDDLNQRELRRVIYHDIVQPLEDELHQGFQYIAIDELDKMADTFDFGQWGRVMQAQSRASSTAPDNINPGQEPRLVSHPAGRISRASTLQMRGRPPSPVSAPPQRRLREISPSGDTVFEQPRVETWIGSASASDAWDP